MWLQNRSCHGGRACIWQNLTCSSRHTFVVLDLKARALCALGKLSTSALHPQLPCCIFISCIQEGTSMCMQECTDVYTHTCGRWGQPQMDSSGTICLEIAKQTRRTGQQATGICLSLWSACLCSISIGTVGMHHRTCGVLFCCLVLHGFWALNWGPRVLCSKHLIELSLQPVFAFRSGDSSLGTYL